MHFTLPHQERVVRAAVYALLVGVLAFVPTTSFASVLTSEDYVGVKEYFVELLVALDMIPPEKVAAAQEMVHDEAYSDLDPEAFAYLLTDKGYIPEEYYSYMRSILEYVTDSIEYSRLTRDDAMTTRILRTHAQAFPTCGAPSAHFTMTFELTAVDDTLYLPTEIVDKRMATVTRRNSGHLPQGDVYETVSYRSSAEQIDGFFVLKPGESERFTIRMRFQQGEHVSPGYYGLDMNRMPFKYEPDHNAQAYYYHYRFEPMEDAVTDWVEVYDACEAAELRYLERMHELYPDKYPDPTPEGKG